MPEALPDELEKGPETAKAVSLTGAENLQMFMGDPESAETKAIMEAHGIAFGDTVVVNVEGQKSMVVSTSENDFWTRDKAASEAIATTVEVAESRITDLHETASLAKMMMGEATPDAVERHEELVADAIEPLGEEALVGTLEDADVFAEEQGAEEAKSEPSPEEQEIPAEVLATLRTGISHFEEAAKKYDTGVETFDTLAEDAATFRRLIGGIQDTYSEESFRTAMKQLNESIQAKYHMARRNTELGVGDMNGSAESMVRAISTAESLQAVSTNLGEVTALTAPDKTEIVGQKLRMLHTVSDHLNDAIQASYQRGFNEDELRGIVTQLQSLSEGNQQLVISRKLEESISDIRKGLGL
ncbi:MAG: hypothetical protein JWO99_444 [Candidatus Saccharibacteria bacterium]|nr:hypothetical protein [Candidatus Saccharibacteria bacterium]